MKVKPTHTRGRVLMEMNRADDQLLTTTDWAGRPLFRLKRILVPVDFSDCSKKALQYAIPFAKQFQAELVLLHVVQVNLGGIEPVSIDLALLERELREGSEQSLRKLTEQDIAEDLQVQTLVKLGPPVGEIVAVAKSMEIDLILMSTHGRTGLKHVFLGSTTESVVRHAPCPVLVVREQEHEFIAE